MCRYWTELDGEGGVSAEFCKSTGKQCSCSGMEEECNNGMYQLDVNEDIGGPDDER